MWITILLLSTISVLGVRRTSMFNHKSHVESVLPFLFPAETPIRESLQGNHVWCEVREVMDSRNDVNIHYEYYSRKSGVDKDGFTILDGGRVDGGERSDGGNEKKGKEKNPLVVFVHGGAWKFGNSRNHYQIPLLQFLLENDIDIVSCNYRKELWPTPLRDVEATFRNIVENYSDRPIVFFGTSAGGHLAIMAYYYAFLAKQRKGNSIDFKSHAEGNHKMLLFYPAIDVFNQLKQRQLLFPDRNFAGESTVPVTLLSSFFETFVMPQRSRRNMRYPWISPLELIEKAPFETWPMWPSTNVYHGRQDMITLYKGSEYFVESLKFFSGKDEKHSLQGVDGSHNFDIPDCPKTKEMYSEILDWILS